MASSGWQGEKYIHGWGSYNSRFVANLNVISIIRYKTSIKLKGQVKMTCYSNATSYYYYAVNAYVNEQGIGEIKPYTGSSNIRNSSWTKDFEVTISVSSETTTTNVPIRFHDPTTNWVRETVYYQINFDKGLTYPAPDISNAVMTAESTAPYEIIASITGVDFKTNYSKRVITCKIEYAIDGETYENTLGEVSDGSTSLTVKYNASTEEEPWKKIPDGEQAKVYFYVDNGNGKVCKWMTVNCQPQYEAYVVESIQDGDKQVSGDFTGSEIQINNQIKFNPPLASFSLLGNSTQQTYSGKNLLGIAPTSGSTSGGLTWVITEDTITISGTAASTGSNSPYFTLPTPLEAGTYRLTLPEALPFRVSVQMIDTDSSAHGGFAVIQAGQTTNTGTSTWNTARIKLSFVGWTAGDTINFSFPNRVMLSAGEDILDYEPYVGGVPSPNPDYPQDVNVVSGGQTVEIVGKNIFDKSTATDNKRLLADGTLFNDTSYATSDYIVVSPNTTYAYSRGASGGGSSAVVFFTANKTAISRTTPIIPKALSSGTFTTPPNAHYVRLDDFKTLKDTIQLELGNQATTYEPYQGQSYTIDLDTMEFCKIGTYQDYIYKDGDKWYKHAEIGKVVFVGDASERWSIAASGVLYCDSVSDYKRSDNIPISNFSLGNTNVNGAGVVPNNRIAFGSANLGAQNRFYVRYDGRWLDADAFTAWLSTHNTTVYYVLATPTDTEITDSELVEQLENIMKNFRFYDGINNIFETSSSGAQGEIEISYYTYWQKFTEAILSANAKNGANQFKEIRRIGTK